MEDNQNHTFENLVVRPDWQAAMKAVSPPRCIPASFVGEEGSLSCFMDAVGMLVKLHNEFGRIVTEEEIKKMVDAFSNKIIQIYATNSAEAKEPLLRLGECCCPICFEVFDEPLTLRCGHSYCKKCLEKEINGNQCRVCSYRFTSMDLNDTRPNVLLISLVDKILPKYKIATSLRLEGDQLLRQKMLHEAVEKYTEAVELNHGDHLPMCNRAHALLIMNQYMTALGDAELAIQRCPFYFQSYLRKAAALDYLGRYEDAFCTLALSIYIVKVSKPRDDTCLTRVKNEMVKVLVKMFSSALTAAHLSLRRRNIDTSTTYSPYPELKKRCNRNVGDVAEPSSDCSSSSSGDESEGKFSFCLKEFPSLQPQKSPGQTTHDPVATRLHHIFSLAIQEVVDFGRQNIPIQRPLDQSIISVADFECSLCYRLLYQPVSTICGHTYCRSCLERCLDHAPTCPLCKTSLETCVAYRRHAITYALDQLICRLYQKEHDERISQHLEELADCCQTGKSKELEIPIFVCTMSFPTVPCNLHVFEPRYRLMVRRCMEAGSKKFGMCCYLQDGDHNYGDFGTMLEIRNIQYFPDGRSVINTVGGRRFRVLKKAVKDGYNVATIEYLEDKPIDELSIPRLRETHENVLKVANDWLQKIDTNTRQKIITHFGNMPTPEEDWISIPGGPAWTWWLLAILPLDAKAQLAVLSMTSVLKRLESLQKVLNKVQNICNA